MLETTLSAFDMTNVDSLWVVGKVEQLGAGFRSLRARKAECLLYRRFNHDLDGRTRLPFLDWEPNIGIGSVCRRRCAL